LAGYNRIAELKGNNLMNTTDTTNQDLIIKPKAEGFLARVANTKLSTLWQNSLLDCLFGSPTGEEDLPIFWIPIGLVALTLTFFSNKDAPNIFIGGMVLSLISILIFYFRNQTNNKAEIFLHATLIFIISTFGLVVSLFFGDMKAKSDQQQELILRGAPRC
jgi:hypothetical protein